jgi:hypothetical protein
MGKGSNKFTRFLSLQYFKVLPAYSTHYQSTRIHDYFRVEACEIPKRLQQNDRKRISMEEVSQQGSFV